MSRMLKVLNKFPAVKNRMARNRELVRFLRWAFAGKSGRHAVRDRFLDMRDLIKVDNPVIIDGGAHMGDMIDIFLSLFPNPTIHAFEPIPNLVQQLKDKYGSNPNIIIHPYALGPEAKVIQFNVLSHAASSSALEPTKTNQDYHPGMMELSQKIDVQQVRMDEVLDLDIDILKLDLQGYEMPALQGAEGLLGRVKLMTIEVEFLPMYEGQALFSDLDVYLRGHGFRLLNLYELYTRKSGQVEAGDAVYYNTRYFQL